MCNRYPIKTWYNKVRRGIGINILVQNNHTFTNELQISEYLSLVYRIG